MKKVILFIFGIIVSAECSLQDSLRWNDSWIPDFRLAVEPVMFNESSGCSVLFEAGRQNYRANGTIGYAFNDDCFGKITGEYLTQKLGFSFCSVHEHHWTCQGAIGFAALSYYADSQVEWGFSYSHADKKNLSETVVPRQNVICKKKIAGSDGVRLFCGSEISPWDSSTLTGKIVYDYLKFNRTFQKNKIVQGFGLNIGFDQYLFNSAKLHFGFNWEAPFIAYDASIATQFYFLNRFFDMAVYSRRVHGQKSIPSSSLIGIEIGINLESLWSGKPLRCQDTLSTWLSEPAVYMPQVLVMKDQKPREFGRAPLGNLPSTITFTSENVAFDLSQYFIGTTPLVFEAISLPSGLMLHPITGKMTGNIAPGSYDVIIKATNYFGNYSQLVTFNY